MPSRIKVADHLNQNTTKKLALLRVHLRAGESGRRVDGVHHSTVEEVGGWKLVDDGRYWLAGGTKILVHHGNKEGGE